MEGMPRGLDAFIGEYGGLRRAPGCLTAYVCPHVCMSFEIAASFYITPLRNFNSSLALYTNYYYKRGRI